MRLALIIIALALLTLTLTACTGDPFGTAAAEHERTLAQVQTAQIQADAATAQARIDASTERVRVGGWLLAAAIGGIVVVLVAGIAGVTHLQAQRDRLSAEQWRTALPTQPTARALPRSRPVSQRPALPWNRTAPAPTLALPERSASTHDVIVIDA